MAPCRTDCVLRIFNRLQAQRLVCTTVSSLQLDTCGKLPGTLAYFALLGPMFPRRIKPSLPFYPDVVCTENLGTDYQATHCSCYTGDFKLTVTQKCTNNGGHVFRLLLIIKLWHLWVTVYPCEQLWHLASGLWLDSSLNWGPTGLVCLHQFWVWHSLVPRPPFKEEGVWRI